MSIFYVSHLNNISLLLICAVTFSLFDADVTGLINDSERDLAARGFRQQRSMAYYVNYYYTNVRDHKSLSSGR